MEIAGKVCVVTGAASGIGRALAQRFAREGAKAVVVADLNEGDLQKTADEIGGTAVVTDVSKEADVQRLAQTAMDRHGPIDLFCSNAGIAVGTDEHTPDEVWERIWEVNVKAHIYAARAVVPAMIARGEGYLLNTASAAGLLTQIGSAPYAVTKHAAVSFAEWLSITYGSRGLKVSCLCPQGVKTNMLAGGGGALLGPTAIEPEDAAEAVIQGLRAETFLILPHPEVREYFRRKGDDYDRWINGMRRLQDRVLAAGYSPTPTGE